MAAVSPPSIVVVASKTALKLHAVEKALVELKAKDPPPLQQYPGMAKSWE